MLISGIQILGGLVLLGVGAEGLVRGSVALAMRMGISRLVVGLTVVAFGTSSPEMVVGVRASLAGESELVLGNMIGSNICNVGLILGVAALLRPVSSGLQLLRYELPVNIVASGVVWWMLSRGMLTRLEGVLLLGLFVAYTVGGIALARRERNTRCETGGGGGAVDDLSGSGGLVRQWGMVIGGIVMLSLGADWLVTGAVDVATELGVSRAVIGLTMLALGTSLPELAAAVVASLKNEGDIVLGNIIGSNLFNILWVLGLAGVISPATVGEIQTLDLGMMTLLAGILLPLMWSRMKVSRWEGGLLLGMYAVYIGLLAAR